MRKLKVLLLAAAVLAGLSAGATVTASAEPAARIHTDWTTPIGVLKRPGGNCSGSVVHGNHHNVVMTAAHCVANQRKENLSFWPHYKNGGQDPTYGVWYVQQILVPDQYRQWDRTHGVPAGHHHKSNPYDFAFLIMKPYRGQNIEDRTGSLYPQAKINAHGQGVTISGYNNGARNRSQCIGNANGHNFQGNWYVKVDCPHAPLGGGTSGSPFILNGTYTVVGLMGGYQEGGDSDYTEYSSWFENTFINLYNRAKG